MATNPLFSYTKRDYESSRQEGLAKIPSLSKGNWTDLNVTDPGIIILDYVHALVDMVNYYQDHQALETFLSTAKERANLFRIAKQLSYKVRSAKGATAEVRFVSSLTYDHPIKIPKYTRIVSREGINYLTSEDAYLGTMSTMVTVPCTQGNLGYKQYTGTGMSRYSSELNAKNQVLNLATENIDMDSISIEDNLGREWERVDYISFAESGKRVYELELRPDNTIDIKFGDGERGAVPQQTDILTITYIVTDAENGRVGANSLLRLQDEIYDTNGAYVSFSITNPEASTGGSSPQSSEEIKALAPGAIKAQDRAVTLSDFENLAKLVEGVKDAIAYDVNTDPDILAHEVKVIIIPREQESSTMLKSKVYEYLYRRMLPTMNLTVLLPAVQTIDIDVVVQKLSSDSDELEYEINKVINNYFDDRSGILGDYFYPTDLSVAVASIPGVRYVVSITPSNPVEINKSSIAKLGNLNITVR